MPKERFFGTGSKKLWTKRARAKELYLSSDAAALCDAARLAELIAERGANGAKTDFVRWKESRHCAHLLDEREQYVGALRAFVGV